MAISETLADQALQLVDKLNEYGMISEHGSTNAPTVEEIWRSLLDDEMAAGTKLEEDTAGGRRRVVVSDAESSIVITFENDENMWSIDTSVSRT